MNSNNKGGIAEILSVFGSHGVCESGQRWLRCHEKSLETLVHVWRRWPEYFMEHYDFAIKSMRENLCEEDFANLEKNRLFVDRKAKIKGLQLPHDPIYVLGDSDVALEFDAFGTARIYCFGESSLTVSGDSSVRLTIDLFGDSRLIVKGTMRPRVYRYDESSVEGNADVKDKHYERGAVFNGREMGDYDERNW